MKKQTNFTHGIIIEGEKETYFELKKESNFSDEIDSNLDMLLSSYQRDDLAFDIAKINFLPIYKGILEAMLNYLYEQEKEQFSEGMQKMYSILMKYSNLNFKSEIKLKSPDRCIIIKIKDRWNYCEIDLDEASYPELIEILKEDFAKYKEIEANPILLEAKAKYYLNDLRSLIFCMELVNPISKQYTKLQIETMQYVYKLFFRFLNNDTILRSIWHSLHFLEKIGLTTEEIQKEGKRAGLLYE